MTNEKTADSSKIEGRPDEIRDGEVSLPVMVYRPSSANPVAAVILCPGGMQKGMLESLDWLATQLATAGILALAITWRDSSPAHDPQDIDLAIDWLLHQPNVDPARIGIYGMSRGGNAAFRAAAADSRLRAVATFGPVTNFIQQAEGAAVYAPGRHRMLIGWLGDPVKDRTFYETIQAITYAGQIKQPVLMVHGLYDMHSPPEQSIWMKEGIEKGGNTKVQLELIPGMGHFGEVIPNSCGFEQLSAIFVPYFLEQLAAQ